MTLNQDDKIVIIAIICVLGIFAKNVVAQRKSPDYYPPEPGAHCPPPRQEAP